MKYYIVLLLLLSSIFAKAQKGYSELAGKASEVMEEAKNDAEYQTGYLK